MVDIGYIAAFLTTVAFVPQAVKTIRTRDTSGISLAMYVCLTIGIFLWLLYGLNLGDGPLIGANALTLFLAVPILVITAINSRREKKRALK